MLLAVTSMFKFKSLVIAVALAFFSFILWVIYLADTGGIAVFSPIVSAIPYGDKVGHFSLFGLLTLAANMATFGKKLTLGLPKKGPIFVYLGSFAVSVFVLLEELSQGFIATRTLDYRDLLADAAGIFVFSIVSYYLLSFSQPKKN